MKTNNFFLKFIDLLSFGFEHFNILRYVRVYRPGCNSSHQHKTYPNFSWWKSCVPNPVNFGTDPDSRPVPLDYGSCSFHQWLSKRQQKESFFRLLLTVGTFTSVFKDNKPCGSHKTEQIKAFPNYFACWRKVPDPEGPDLHSDPEHCKKE
jgi:hypothetical protein